MKLVNFNEKKYLEFSKGLLRKNSLFQMLSVSSLMVILIIILKNILLYEFTFLVHFSIAAIYVIFLNLPLKRIKLNWRKSISDHHGSFFIQFENFMDIGTFESTKFKNECKSWYIKAHFYVNVKIILISVSLALFAFMPLLLIFEIEQTYYFALFYHSNPSLFLGFYTPVFNIIIFPYSILIFSIHFFFYLCECYKNRYIWLIEAIIRKRYLELSETKESMVDAISGKKVKFRYLKEQIYDDHKEIEAFYSLKFLRILKLSQYNLTVFKKKLYNNQEFDTLAIIKDYINFFETIYPPKDDRLDLKIIKQKFNNLAIRIESDQTTYFPFPFMKVIRKSKKKFYDDLERASYFLKKGHKDAAAVIASNNLENFLRELCGTEIGIYKDDGTPKKAKTLNSELSNQNYYLEHDRKQIEAWLGLRNDAAHGWWNNYHRNRVKAFISGLKEFKEGISCKSLNKSR